MIDMVNGTIQRIEVVTSDNYFRYGEGGMTHVKLKIVEDSEAIIIVQMYEAHNAKGQIVQMCDYTTFNKSDIKKIHIYSEEVEANE